MCVCGGGGPEGSEAEGANSTTNVKCLCDLQ